MIRDVFCQFGLLQFQDNTVLVDDNVFLYGQFSPHVVDDSSPNTRTYSL